MYAHGMCKLWLFDGDFEKLLLGSDEDRAICHRRCSGHGVGKLVFSENFKFIPSAYHTGVAAIIAEVKAVSCGDRRWQVLAGKAMIAATPV
jgi:hypothetical protein